MPDTIALTSDIGTWLAILLGLIALLGIVGPLLLLRKAGSARNRALVFIDSRSTGYVTKGILFGIRYPNILQLSAPPSPQTLSRPTGSEPALSSKTGWVNIASIIEIYAPRIERGGSIHMYNDNAWLPVHKLWILALGLRGRFGHREDKGHARTTSRASRLLIERENSYEDGGYGDEPSTEKLYGITGTLWWKRTFTASEFPMDQVYFATHPLKIRQPLTPDTIPLSTLFWLAMGCIPLTTATGTKVFHLAWFEGPFTSRPEPGEDENDDYKFMPYSDESELSEPNVPRSNVKTQGGLRNNGFKRFAPRSDPVGHSTHKSWASAMDAQTTHLYTVEITTPLANQSSLVTVEARSLEEQSEWEIRTYTTAPRLEADISSGIKLERGKRKKRDLIPKTFLWKADAQCIVLAILQLPVSPLGFLFDYSYGTSVFNFVARGCGKLIPRLTKWLLDNTDVSHDGLDARVLRDVFDAARARGPRAINGGRYVFSRRWAQCAFELDVFCGNRVSSLPPVAGDAVGILAICSSSSLARRLKEALKKPSTVTGEEESKWYVETDRASNVVRTSFGEDGVVESHVDFATLFPLPPGRHADVASSRYTHKADLVWAVLRACVKCSAFENCVVEDSEELIKLVQEMEDVVFVSPHDRAPRLYRRRSRSRGKEAHEDSESKSEWEGGNEGDENVSG